jgi:hypothetical protein
MTITFERYNLKHGSTKSQKYKNIRKEDSRGTKMETRKYENPNLRFLLHILSSFSFPSLPPSDTKIIRGILKLISKDHATIKYLLHGKKGHFNYC